MQESGVQYCPKSEGRKKRDAECNYSELSPTASSRSNIASTFRQDGPSYSQYAADGTQYADDA